MYSVANTVLITGGIVSLHACTQLSPCWRISIYPDIVNIILYTTLPYYTIAGNFRGIQFSRKGCMQRFRDLIFEDGRSECM